MKVGSDAACHLETVLPPRRRSGLPGFSFANRSGALALVVVGLAFSTPVVAEPFIPDSSDEVIDHVRSPGISAASKEIRELERVASGSSQDFSTALRLVRRRIDAARDEADPRHLGRAQADLEPWISRTNPPAEALFLRATIRQGLHEFDAAMADLDVVLGEVPTHTGAWLIRAMIQCVRADFSGARMSATRLLRSGDEFIAMTAAANIASLTGQSANAMRQLETVLDRNPEAPAKMRVWALTILAETAGRRGAAERAEEFYRRALGLAPRNPYLLGAYADFLLDRARNDEAAALLKDFREIDSLLLRYAEALPEERKLAVRSLKARIEINQARGERTHLREEGRIHLRLLGQPTRALALARENWASQKEPADARLLLESARAAGDAGAEQDLMGFLKAQRLEDVSLGLPVSSY